MAIYGRPKPPAARSAAGGSRWGVCTSSFLGIDVLDDTNKGVVDRSLEVSMKRHRIAGGKSRRSFSKSASRTHVKNIRDKPMRGGIRL